MWRLCIFKEPSKNLTKNNIIKIRGDADSIGTQLRHHNSAIHKKYTRGDPVSEKIFNSLERSRCQALGSFKLRGLLKNITNKLMLDNDERIKDIKSNKDLKIEDFFELLKFRGSKLSKNEVSKKLNQISNNLTDFEKWLNDNKMEAQNAEKTINNKVLSYYINSTVETKKKIYLVFKDPKVKNFKVCENTTLLC